MHKIYDHILILHGCPPSEEMVTTLENRWMNWVSDELQKKGYDATALQMPTSWNPKYSQWSQEFEKYTITENTMLIGHSCGAAFFVRWLLENQRKVKKLILVAPAKIPETEDDTRKDLYDFELPTQDVSIAEEIVLFTSNDFPHHLQSRDLYIDSLKPKVITLDNKGHFLYFQMRTQEFPELLAEALS